MQIPSLRTALPGLAIALLAACSAPEPTVLARIGEACQSAADCGSKRCEQGLCTRDCIVQADCPEGFDCSQFTPDDPGGLCVRAAWTNPEKGGFGTNCSPFADGCGGPNPCADGFSCRASLKCDAAAYCTKGCGTDADCPPTMFCGQDDRSVPKSCLKRGACQPCGADDQCPSGHVCATLASGARFCAKTCAGSGDCLRPNLDSQSGSLTGKAFETCQDDAGGKGKVCTPVSGACVGAGPLTGAANDAGICHACRLGRPDDCGANGRCFEDATSRERFCTIDCTVQVQAGSNGQYGIVRGTDNCPAGAACMPRGGIPDSCGTRCTLNGFCNGDPSYANTTCYPL